MSLRSSVQQFPTEEAVPFGFLGRWPAVATGPAARQENKDSDTSGTRVCVVPSKSIHLSQCAPFWRFPFPFSSSADRRNHDDGLISVPVLLLFGCVQGNNNRRSPPMEHETSCAAMEAKPLFVSRSVACNPTTFRTIGSPV